MLNLCVILVRRNLKVRINVREYNIQLQIWFFFVDEAELDKHIKNHAKIKKHKCNDCGKSFHYKVGLRTHMRTHGIGERKHVCSQCGKKFYEPNDLMVR